jgi:hypothetical protein
MEAGGLCVLGIEFQQLVLRRIVPVLVAPSILRRVAPVFCSPYERLTLDIRGRLCYCIIP